MTPSAVLAETIAFGGALDTSAVEDIVDASLAEPDDFLEVRDPEAEAGAPPRWCYVADGERWQVRYRDGRAELVEVGTVVPGHVEVAERRFAGLVRMMEQINAHRLTDGEVAALRADPGNAAAFRQAAEGDQWLAEFRASEGPAAEVARERLLRVRRIVERLGLLPGGDMQVDLEADDESWVHRYLLIYSRRRSGGTRSCDARSCEDLETLVEWAICMTIVDGRLVGTWDLSAESGDPLTIDCDLRVEDPDGNVHSFGRMVPFELAGEVHR